MEILVQNNMDAVYNLANAANGCKKEDDCTHFDNCNCMADDGC